MRLLGPREEKERNSELPQEVNGPVRENGVVSHVAHCRGSRKCLFKDTTIGGLSKKAIVALLRLPGGKSKKGSKGRRKSPCSLLVVLQWGAWERVLSGPD